MSKMLASHFKRQNDQKWPKKSLKWPKLPNFYPKLSKTKKKALEVAL
jgi:hypothetical protein